MKQHWKILGDPPRTFFDTHPEYSRVTTHLLWNRNLHDEADIEKFFNPRYEVDLHDPFLFNDMEKAVTRVHRAVSQKEKIILWGDYDADGVSGVSLLYHLFRALGAEEHLDVYIPDRNKDGYGVNIQGVEQVAREGARLIISVDCGLSNNKEIARAHELGVDVVVCDHHLAPEVNPPALAVINPKAKDTTYPYPYLAGTGVAFKLAHAILTTCPKELLMERNIQEGFEKWFLDLVAIATVADRMPLLGENRMLVKYGLIVMAQTKKRGLRMLLGKTGITPMFDFSNLASSITTRDLGFTIIPRINAMGRLAHASTSFELMVTESEEEAGWLVRTMEEKNLERSRLVEEAMKTLQESINPHARLIFSSFDDSALPGILSSISNKMVEKHRKPVFLLARQAEKSFGSVRSGGFFNCVEALREVRELLLDFGGHPFAAGFSIMNQHIPALEERITRVVERYVQGDPPDEELVIDKEVAFGEIGFELLKDLEKFEPFGEGNPMPRFLVRNTVARDYKFVGNGEKHVRFTLGNPDGDERDTRSAIGFFMGSKISSLNPMDRMDIVFEIERDRYRGGKSVSLKVVDFTISE